jgi:hypothetical protein
MRRRIATRRYKTWNTRLTAAGNAPQHRHKYASRNETFVPRIVLSARCGATRQTRPSPSTLLASNGRRPLAMPTHHKKYAIGIGLLCFMSFGWLVGSFLGLVPGYSPPAAALLGICGIVGSTVALKKGFGSSSVWLRRILVLGLFAAVAGLAAGIFLSFGFWLIATPG